MAYAAALLLHSWIRWVVLVFGVVVLYERFVHWRRAEEPRLSWTHHVFIRALGLQFLLGLLLYLVLSPITRAAFADFGPAMGDPVRRFYAIEHGFGMFVAISSAHIGFIRLWWGERGRTPAWARVESAGKIAFFTQLVWLLVTLLSVPWPGLPYGRSLVRLVL